MKNKKNKSAFAHLIFPEPLTSNDIKHLQDITDKLDGEYTPFITKVLMRMPRWFVTLVAEKWYKPSYWGKDKRGNP